jgi:hypothetical protein
VGGHPTRREVHGTDRPVRAAARAYRVKG